MKENGVTVFEYPACNKEYRKKNKKVLDRGGDVYYNSTYL